VGRQLGPDLECGGCPLSEIRTIPGYLGHRRAQAWSFATQQNSLESRGTGRRRGGPHGHRGSRPSRLEPGLGSDSVRTWDLSTRLSPLFQPARGRIRLALPRTESRVSTPNLADPLCGFGIGCASARAHLSPVPGTATRSDPLRSVGAGSRAPITLPLYVAVGLEGNPTCRESPSALLLWPICVDR